MTTYEVCSCIHAGHKHAHPWIHRVYICILYVCVCECSFMPLLLDSAENNQLITLIKRGSLCDSLFTSVFISSD